MAVIRCDNAARRYGAGVQVIVLLHIVLVMQMVVVTFVVLVMLVLRMAKILSDIGRTCSKNRNSW